MNNWCICWIFTHINEIHGSRSKISSKNLVRQRCAEGFNSGVKGLTSSPVPMSFLMPFKQKAVFRTMFKDKNLRLLLSRGYVVYLTVTVVSKYPAVSIYNL
jgi:hypothetical protein